MPRFAEEVLRPLAAAILERLGSTPESARAVADHLVGANLAGHDSHGLIRLPQYCDHARRGLVAPAAAPEIVREGPTTALIDGRWAWGQVVAGLAAELALARARAHAVGVVAARAVYHIGRAGVYLTAAARAGFVAQAFVNGHGIPRVAPWGGTEPRLCTNPVAFAFPRRRGRPIVVDLATTAAAEGKVRLAQAEKRRVPEGWVMDAAGRPATDPGALYAGGSLLPLGGREGHKGYCLALAVDVLGGLLPGAGAGGLNPRLGNGCLFLVLDPRAFGEEADFLDHIEEYAAYLKSSPCKAGVEEVLLPGEPEAAAEERRRREGIAVDDETWGKIAALARELGVRLPEG